MKYSTIAKVAFSSLAATIVVSGSLANAQPDLRITAMSMQGQAREGDCNKVRMTVRNSGNEFTDEATIDIFLATYTQSSSNQNRAEKSFFVSPLQPDRQHQFTIDKVEFKAQGSMTVQALVDSTQEVAESSEGNNSRTLNVNVNGKCGQPTRTPITRQDDGCDLELTFTQPGSSSVAYNQNTTYRLQAKNVGDDKCNSVKLRLYRYNSSTASGYGSAVGGTRNIKLINALNPGQSQNVDFSDNPKAKGSLTYAPKFLGAWNDDNNNNHRPKKTVKAQ